LLSLTNRVPAKKGTDNSARRDLERIPVKWTQNSAARSVSSPPHVTRACPGYAFECASRAGPTCGGEGLGVGVERLRDQCCQTHHPPPQPSPTREEGADRVCGSR
jgi:hypothetical protein